MAPWPFFNASSKVRTPPSRTITPHQLDNPTTTDYFSGPHQRLDDDDDADALDFDDLDAPAPPFAGSSSSRSHSRSLSNTLFGAKKKPAAAGSPTGLSPTIADAQLDGPISPRKPAGKSKAEEPDLDTGTCATCASKMQWPHGLTEYRCATCLMINDLKVPDGASTIFRGKDGLSRSDTNPSPGARIQVPPIDLEKTKTLIDRCVDAALESRATEYLLESPQDSLPDANRPTKSPTAEEALLKLSEAAAPVVPRSPTKRTAKSPSLKPVRPAGDHPVPTSGNVHQPKSASLRRKPLPLQTGKGEDNKSSELPIREMRKPDETAGKSSSRGIFRALEEYIVQTYANYECLNCSFILAKPKARQAGQSEEDMRGRAGPSAQEQVPLTSAPLSDLDAKTLLLGDVAENGLWWTGRDSRPHSVGRRSKDTQKPYSAEIVHTRSPRINWAEVHSWYRLIVRAGDDWRHRKRHLEHIGKIKSFSDPSFGDYSTIESLFTEARAHVQRTLLKAAEVVLKRPGRPLRNPGDVRFLLIIFANPLLYSSGSSSPMTVTGKELASMKDNETSGTVRSHSIKDVRPNPNKLGSAGSSEQGLTFGIVKRALGLASNLPDDCHRYLIAWLSRYHETQYRQLQGLVQGFITYRLGRLQQRDKYHEGNPAGSRMDLFTAGDRLEARLTNRLEYLDTGHVTNPVLPGGYSIPSYCGDWQIKAAARFMTLLFAANKHFYGQRISPSAQDEDRDPAAISRTNLKQHGQLLSTSDFYNLRTDYIDVAADFTAWESSKQHFSFCQYPFLLSVGTKIRMMEFDSQRQMRVSAREACFENLFNNKALQQYLVLRVRRECLIEDSLTGISEVVAQGVREFKKALKVQFVDEPGVDAGGLKKEWFLLLVREIFDPNQGLFIYDEESRLCYFNPHSFETSDQFFLVGALIGFAIYNLTILDVALPPFLFKRLLAPANSIGPKSALDFSSGRYSLDDLAEYRPALARGLQKLLEYDDDVESTFGLNFMIDIDRYGSVEQVALIPNATNVPVTNSNRKEYVDLYIQHHLETQVTRQYEPFKRGFNMVCGGNAISLFQPEEIELVIRGSDEPLDVSTLKSVAVYGGWRQEYQAVKDPANEISLIKWFWEIVESADPKSQRQLLSFVTGSDRIPATGASNLIIKIVFAGDDYSRYPVARTCFNQISLYKYRNKEELVVKLWRAVSESEGFGLR